MEATKLTALEEEISILKGEIKSILQEVRTAILASENPFSGGLSPRPAAVAVETHHSEPKVVQLHEPPPTAAHTAVPPAALPDDAGGRISAEATRHSLDGEHGPVPAALPAQPQRREPPPPAPQPETQTRRSAPGVRALAALLTWVEETRHRLDERRYRVVLSLANYGELIDTELEKTLIDAGKTVGGKETHERASVNDSIVALRQLEAILAPDNNVRRFDDYGFSGSGGTDGSYREVWPSRRQ